MGTLLLLQAGVRRSMHLLCGGGALVDVLVLSRRGCAGLSFHRRSCFAIFFAALFCARVSWRSCGRVGCSGLLSVFFFCSFPLSNKSLSVDPRHLAAALGVCYLNGTSIYIYMLVFCRWTRRLVRRSLKRSKTW